MSFIKKYKKGAGYVSDIVLLLEVLNLVTLHSHAVAINDVIAIVNGLREAQSGEMVTMGPKKVKGLVTEELEIVREIYFKVCSRLEEVDKRAVLGHNPYMDLSSEGRITYLSDRSKKAYLLGIFEKMYSEKELNRILIEYEPKEVQPARLAFVVVAWVFMKYMHFFSK